MFNDQSARSFILNLYRQRGIRIGQSYPAKPLWLQCLNAQMSQAVFRDVMAGLAAAGIFDQEGVLLQNLDYI